MDYKPSEYMLKIQGWTNSNWVGDQNSYKSTSRYIILFARGAISWQCKKQAIVALSSIKVKYIALALATKEVVWLAQSMKDLGLPKLQPIPFTCDNQSCIVLSKTTKDHDRIKHIEIKYHYS